MRTEGASYRRYRCCLAVRRPQPPVRHAPLLPQASATSARTKRRCPVPGPYAPRVTLRAETTDGLDQGILGVALSGGGVRAALFSVGALRAAVEHATSHDKRLLVSTVSGSALLALELAWSGSADDEQALDDVATRITKHGYWLRRRWWVGASALLLGAALAYAIWNYRDYSAAATTLWAAPILFAALMMLVALFRTQGLWYRTQRLPVAFRRPSPNIYSATRGDFPSNKKRLLSLDNFVFNATALSTGKYASFEGPSLPKSGAVREFAEASAAFPGAFLPRSLPGEEGLYADGGIYDNTGITYFQQLQRRPKYVLAVDAGAGFTPAPRLPYAWLNSFINRVPGLFGLASALVVVGSVAGVVADIDWLPTVLFWSFLASILIVSVVVPVAALEGAWNDVRWFGRGWPTTLRVTSDLHLERFREGQNARGGRLAIVSLREGASGAQAKTQLWKLPEDLARKLIDAGYESARAQLRGLV